MPEQVLSLEELTAQQIEVITKIHAQMISKQFPVLVYKSKLKSFRIQFH